jgi:ATP-dependent DNA helicase RecG
MVALNMIDKSGYGIHEMAESQIKRYLPLSDYLGSDDEAVRLTIYGGVIDPKYSQLLMQRADIPFPDIVALDRLQKRQPISEEIKKHLRRAGLIEGREPNIHISAAVAAVTDQKADYIRTRAQHDAHFQKLILDYLDKNGEATRKEIDKLLLPILSVALDENQKSHKVAYLLTSLRRAGKIKNYGSDRSPVWKPAHDAE